MAALPSPTQVAGSHFQIYETFYLQVDPTNQGTIGALDAAKFLKKSGLPDRVLRQIWDLSDPNGKGFLTKLGFFVALKLVSLAQAGKEVSIANISLEMPPPKMNEPAIPPTVPTATNNLSYPNVPAMAKPGDWAMKPSEKAKYDQLFDLMKPINGIVPGNEVKGLLIDSHLPVDTLGKIWDLADMDKDGSFDKHEFTVAMHLVYKALEKYAIPSTLPPELLPPGKKRDSIKAPTVPSPIPVLPIVPALMNQEPEPMKPPPIPPVPSIPWVVSREEKARYDVQFTQSDFDKDGYVSGVEIKDVFLQSGLPQDDLAIIWSLCDIGQTGKLNSEQFALAMWMVNQKLKGFDPPQALTPEMVPPSFRSKLQNSISELSTSTPYSNPELDVIGKDIEGFVREKLNLETEIAQKEADIQIKSGEIKSLQGELDALSATLKQLEHQKGEAQNRLNDLRNQKALVESELADVKMELKAEQAQVDKLRGQAEEQENMLKSQEAELNSKKLELEGLKNEEIRLEQQQNELKNKLDRINSNLQESQLQISQVKAKVSALEETQRQMKDAIALAESAIASGDASGISDSSLSIEPEFRDPSYTRLLTQPEMSSQNDGLEDNKATFDSKSQSNDSNFVNNAAFKSDPFASTTTSDPFSSNSSSDPFSRFPNKPADGFASDPFNSFNSGSKATNKTDPFGDTSRSGAKTPSDLADKDAFGCDPFAILHAPTAATLSTHPSSAPARPESPSPALPPKKSKQPPPRPAPPRPMQQPTNVNHSNDPFAPFASNNNNSVGEFADFSNFNNKFSDTSSTISTLNSSRNSLSKTSGLEFTEDPFRDYRYEDPFSIADPFEDTDSSVDVPSKLSHSKLFSNSLDAFGINFNDSVFKNNNINKQLNGKLSDTSSLPSEEEQLAWAASDSLRLEEERKKQTAQAKADMELALKLSKSTTKKNRFFS